MTRKTRKIEKFVATAPGRHCLGQTSVVDPLGMQGDAVFLDNARILQQFQIPLKLPKISTKRPCFKKNRLRRATLSFSQEKLS